MSGRAPGRGDPAPAGLVGRETELATLGAALADAAPALVLIEGEAGIGKTRLLRDYLHGRRRQRRALAAVCPPFRQPQTLGSLTDAVRRAADGVAALGLSPLAGALRPLLPEWADELPPALEPAHDPTVARHRLFRALAELIDRLEAGLVVVEDAHWADDATLEFLLFLAADQDRRTDLVVTCRPEDVEPASPLRQLMSRRPAAGTQLRIELGPLSAAETAEMVSVMLGGEPVSAEFAAFIHERTDGVPLAVEEIMKLLADRADLFVRDGHPMRRPLTEMVVPASIRDAVLERVQRLSDDAQAVLRAVAVLGGPAAADTAITVAGIDQHAVPDGMLEALRCGLVAEDDSGLVSFRHALASQAVYEAIPVSLRRRLHLRAGAELERASPAPVAQLARHYHEAGDSARWMLHAEAAADIAAAAGDQAAADRLTCELVMQPGLTAPALIRLTGKISFAVNLGRQVSSQLVSVLQTALSDRDLPPADGAMLRTRLARVLMANDDRIAAQEEMRRSAPHLPEGTPEAAWVMTNLTNLMFQPAAASATEQLRWLRQAADVTVPASTVEGMRLLADRVVSLLMLGEDSGWADAAHIADDSAEPAVRAQVARGWSNIADVAVRWGRYEEARSRLAQARQLAGELGVTRLVNSTRATLVHLDLLTGAWTGLAERAGMLAEDEGVQPGGRTEALLVTAILQLVSGETEPARQGLTTALAAARKQGVFELALEAAGMLAWLNLADGDTQQALAVTDDPAGTVMAKDAWILAGELAPARVAALAAAGRISEADDLVAAMEAGVHGRAAPGPLAALMFCRAVLAGARGEHGRAADLYERAALAWQALPRPYNAWLSRERRGHCLLAAGDRGAGLDLLAQTARELARLGATADSRRINRWLREQGVYVKNPALGRPSYGDELSPRELEVARLVAAGLTDKAIGEKLFISPRTVAFHVESARRKLNAASRTVLAAIAVERGLA